jgi:hypothetical protein
MPDVTYYVALAFADSEEGLVPREAIECTSAHAAVARAEIFSRKDGMGALAFSRTGDPSTGDFADAVLLHSFGNVPTDLSAL